MKDFTRSSKKLALGFLLLLRMKEVWSYDHDEFLVEALADIEPAFGSFEGKMYSGLLPFHLKLDQEGGKFMFWLFEPDEPSVPNALSIYISGGPGCSSIGTGALFGSAPVTVPKAPAGVLDPADKDLPFEPNPNSWAKATNLLYIEQPATTGFSYGPLPQDEDDVSRDLFNFLINFFDTFQHLKHNDLFIWGGSYSGMMVPAIARKIYHENKKKDHMHMNLSGIGLGNAWLDPDIQAPAIVDFAWSHGMIDANTKDTFHEYWKDCRQGLSLVPPMHPFDMPDECGLDEIILQAAGEGLFEDLSPNPYDITTWDPYNILGDDGRINKFYNNPKVQKILHARPIDWYGCVDPQGPLLKYDKPESVVPYVAELLDEANIRVIFFNGDRDLLCCHTGTDLMLDAMKWSKASEWKSARRGVWMVEERVAGYTKSLGNLEYVVVYNSGHMMAHNQPVRSLDLVKRFLKGDTLLDVELPSYPRSHQRVEKNVFSRRKFVHHGVIAVFAALFVFVAFLFMKHYRKCMRHDYKKVPDSDITMQFSTQ